MNICMSVPAASISPSRIAPAIWSSRTINLLVDAALRLAVHHDLVGRRRGSGLAHRGQLHAHHLQLGAELRAGIRGVRDSCP